ncbi:hypothetical protein HK097_000808, partial [Rhizophlyctis rosea]
MDNEGTRRFYALAFAKEELDGSITQPGHGVLWKLAVRIEDEIVGGNSDARDTNSFLEPEAPLSNNPNPIPAHSSSRHPSAPPTPPHEIFQSPSYPSSSSVPKDDAKIVTITGVVLSDILNVVEEVTKLGEVADTKEKANFLVIKFIDEQSAMRVCEEGYIQLRNGNICGVLKGDVGGIMREGVASVGNTDPAGVLEGAVSNNRDGALAKGAVSENKDGGLGGVLGAGRIESDEVPGPGDAAD